MHFITESHAITKSIRSELLDGLARTTTAANA